MNFHWGSLTLNFSIVHWALEILVVTNFSVIEWITEQFSGRSNDSVVDIRNNDPAPQIHLERKDETGMEMTQKEVYLILCRCSKILSCHQ